MFSFYCSEIRWCCPVRDKVSLCEQQERVFLQLLKHTLGPILCRSHAPSRTDQPDKTSSNSTACSLFSQGNAVRNAADSHLVLILDTSSTRVLFETHAVRTGAQRTLSIHLFYALRSMNRSTETYPFPGITFSPEHIQV